VNSFDNLDLNRSFPGDPKGTITQRIANVIFEEFKNCDLVIDIHTVTNVGEFMGMELNTEKKAHVTATERFNRLLNPQAIWRAVEGAKYANALDEALLREGVLGVGVEVPRLEFIDTQMMERIVDGLIAAIATKGKAKKLPSPIPVLANAKRYFSDFGGIYIPKMEVGQRISRGNVVGRVVDLTNFSEKLIRSKWDGVLFVQSSRKVLKTGDKVYVVVDQIGEFQ
jgi:hypothetical protein